MTESERLGPAPLGAIRITGTEASDFLRAQLTNDVLRLGEDRHMLTGWCDAKGRAVLVARIVAQTEGYLMILPATLKEAIVQRLRMYVLRADVELIDVTADYRIEGLIGDDLPEAGCVEYRGARLVMGLSHSTDQTPRAIGLIAPDAEATPDAVDVASNRWELSEIDAGIPIVLPQTQGLFVPQMLNMHWLHAIDFNKGCYPGQEVIARLHYRGRLTRRLFRLAWRGCQQPMPGDDVLDDDGIRQGMVVRAAAADAGSGRLLAVVKIDKATGTLDTAGASLSMQTLPYATPA